MLHIQPRLCHLLLRGFLLPAVHCHPVGLHPYLHLPQDEAEEDRLWPGQRESAARINSAFCGETIIGLNFGSPPQCCFTSLLPRPPLPCRHLNQTCKSPLLSPVIKLASIGLRDCGWFQFCLLPCLREGS